MSYNIELTEHFKLEAKRLAKKYKSLKTDLAKLFIELQSNPILGTPLGNNVYKVRMSIYSKGKGKSGGARVITYLAIENQTILLLTIYNKGTKESISDKEIQALLELYSN